MFQAIRNFFALGVARRSRQRGFFGRLLGLGAARRLSTGRGVSGRLASMGIGVERARMGIGVALGVAALAAGAFGARRMMNQRRGQITGDIGSARTTHTPGSRTPTHV